MDKKGLRYLWTFFIVVVIFLIICYKVNDENKLKEIERLENQIAAYEEELYYLKQK